MDLGNVVHLPAALMDHLHEYKVRLVQKFWPKSLRKSIIFSQSKKKKSQFRHHKKFSNSLKKFFLLILSKISLSISQSLLEMLSHDYYPCLLEVNFRGLVTEPTGLSLYKKVR